MIYPRSLKIGDSLIIVAPSGIVDFGYIYEAKRKIEQWGLNVLLGEYVFKKYGRFAGSIQERLRDLQNSFDNPDVSAILCARGGYGVVQLLNQLSLDKFNLHPKWLIGYSDITALHNVISLSGVCSLHAPMTSHLAIEDEDESVLSLKNILFGHKPVYQMKNHPLNRTGSSTGYTRGGNLSVIQSLRGTPFDLLTENTILFIEDINEKPYHIQRMIYNLKSGGILSKISGLIVGQFSGCEEDPLMNQTIYESIAELVSEYNYPVCFGFPLGHVKDNFPLIENGQANLSIQNAQVILEYI